jgi:hypothetical protein
MDRGNFWQIKIKIILYKFLRVFRKIDLAGILSFLPVMPAKKKMGTLGFKIIF